MSDPGITRAERWVSRLDDVSRQLAVGDISQLQWQEAFDEIYGSVSMNSLLKLIDFGRLSARLASTNFGAAGEIFDDITVGPIPAQRKGVDEESGTAIVKIAHVKKGRSIPPHGHDNMVSAFLCLSGEFAVKLYDRISCSEESMVIRQTVDNDSAGSGSWSSITDRRNNVHWLTAKTDDCFLFTVKLIRIARDQVYRSRINLNLETASQLDSRTWRADIISAQEAAEVY